MCSAELNFMFCHTGIKKVSIPRQRSCEDEESKDHRLYCATPPGKDIGKGLKYHFLFILFSTPCFTSVSVFYDQLFPFSCYYYHSETTHHTLQAARS